MYRSQKIALISIFIDRYLLMSRMSMEAMLGFKRGGSERR